MQLPSQRGADAALRRAKMCVHLKLNAKDRRSEVCPVANGRGQPYENAMTSSECVQRLARR
jgi:hypothetical protein